MEETYWLTFLGPPCICVQPRLNDVATRSVQQIDQRTSAVINRSLTDNEYFTVIAAQHSLPA